LGWRGGGAFDSRNKRGLAGIHASFASATGDATTEKQFPLRIVKKHLA
jgi:hypothetical protein